MTTENGNGTPLLPCWIADFLNYTEGLPTPYLFRLWTGISVVSAALERRVWLNLSGKRAYPNLFVVLVSPPGVGKTVSIDEGREILTEAGIVNVAPESLPGKGLIEHIADDEISARTYTDPELQQRLVYHSTILMPDELGTLIPSHDLGFLSTVNKLFDCGPKHSERTRSGGLTTIPRPHISLLAGTQPKYLGSIFPEEAYGMGFTARVIMVYSAEEVDIDLFGGTGGEVDLKQKEDLVERIRSLQHLNGEFVIEEDVKKAFQAWYNKGMPPRPEHSKLQHYVVRRHFMLAKLMQTMCAARTDDMIVNMDDFQVASHLLLDAEARMPEVFKEISAQSQAAEIEEAYNFLWQEWVKMGRKPVPEQALQNFLINRVPTHQIRYIIDTMIAAGFMQEQSTSGLKLPPHAKQNRCFVPLTQEA